MNISEEIKRMMSLLESEIGNVKPLITEEGDGTGVETNNTPEGILMRAINTGCWTKKNYKFDPANPISKVNANYLYALNKVDPNIRVGDPFVKVKSGDIDVYMFGTPTTNPQYPGAYLAVTRNTKVAKSTDPNLNYLESHGWVCDTFGTTSNKTSQETQMTADQTSAVRTLAGTNYIQSVGAQIFTTKPIGDGITYKTIDMATGKDVNTGQQVIPAQDMEEIKKYNFTPNTFFVYMVAGNTTKRINVPLEVERFFTTLGFTTQEPLPDSAEANSKTNVLEFCNTQAQNRCNDAVLEYANANKTQSIWPMNETQKADAATKGITVQDQESMVGGFDANRRQLKKSRQASQGEFANKRFCNAGIEILSYCSKYNDNGRCAKYMGDLEANGAITFPDPSVSYERKIIALKKLLGDCVIGIKDGSVNIANRYEAPLLELQKSSGPFGLKTATPTQPQQTNQRLATNESLNNSIKSVITEAINKNNNKNLDSIIKKNLRKYIG
jgi:hypothetical protein